MVLREKHVLQSEQMSSRNLSSEVLKATLILNITLYLTFPQWSSLVLLGLRSRVTASFGRMLILT